MRIIGIDPGLQRTGYGVIETAGGPGIANSPARPRLLDGGVIRLDAKTPLADRLVELLAELESLFAEHHPQVVAVEQLYSHYAHPRTAILMGHARGVILVAARQRHIRVEQFAANRIKQAVTGNGHASKVQMQRAIQHQWNLPTPPEPPDVADALATALCCSMHLDRLSMVAAAVGAGVIAAITGQLHHLGEDRAFLRVGPILCEVLVPAADIATLQTQLGGELTFHTLLYLEGDSAGGNSTPRLLGFLRPEDKKFFELFITVKNIGPRKALRALAAPVGQIARAIEHKDAKFLVELPQIGRRIAEQIIAELSGKVEAFVGPPGPLPGRPAPAPRPAPEEDAIATLMALGERRPDAEQLLERAKSADPAITTTNAFVREMLRLRG